ncbi:MAG: site-2 protease family protein [Candidatus Micrarchaeota archaeon]
MKNGFGIGWEEILHILVSVVTISIAFTLFDDFTFDKFFLILITVGTAFILHELGHRSVAIAYGAKARYQAWTLGLFLALVMAFFTSGQFVFAAPGAVYIFGPHLTREQNGKIALAGPMVNLLLAIFFLFALQFSFLPTALAATGFMINAFLGAFNMIPFPPLDGSKVSEWNRSIWLFFFLIFVGLFFLI